jgi:hypothetical protein
MKRLSKEQAKQGGFMGYGCEMITTFRPPYVATTEQRQQGFATANTFAYLITGEFANGDHKLIKHPSIKGSKGYRAIGG